MIKEKLHPLWHFDSKYHTQEVYKHVRSRLNRMPRLTEGERSLALENRHDFAMVLMRQEYDRWEKTILYFLASCPESSWIDRGIDKAVEYLHNKGDGKSINKNTVSANFILTLYSLYRFNAGDSSPEKQYRYYYEQYAFLFTLLCVVDWYIEEGVGARSTRGIVEVG